MNCFILKFHWNLTFSNEYWNNVANNLHYLCLSKGFKPDFAPSKLKAGCGEQCIWVLDCLATNLLQAKHFVWKTYGCLYHLSVVESERVVTVCIGSRTEFIYWRRTEKQLRIAADDSKCTWCIVVLQLTHGGTTVPFQYSAVADSLRDYVY